MSETAERVQTKGRIVVKMTIDDALHYTPQQRAQIIAQYPAHERDARAKGIPQLGSGRVFPVLLDDLLCDPFPVPMWWPLIGGLDFGWDHPSAAVMLAHDPDSDTIYLIREYRKSHQPVAVHAAAVKPWWPDMPWAWPHDGLQHDKTSGQQIAQTYRDHGLNLLPEHAQFADDRGAGLEAGVMEMLDRMVTGRWKVFRNCGAWQEEFSTYHRKDGLIVKERDDTISASRYAMMCIRFAVAKAKAPIMDRYRRTGQRQRGGGWLA